MKEIDSMKRGYTSLSFSSILVETSSAVLVASGMPDAYIEHIEADVDTWEDGGFVTTPISGSGNPIEF